MKSATIEDKANGPAIIEVIQKKIPGVIAVSVEDSKIARACAHSGIIESGNVHLPKGQGFEWVEDFVEEWSLVPNGEFWDQVDAASQALDYLRKNTFDVKSAASLNDFIPTMESVNANW